MRAQRRRFVVEVKRGTSRASFISTDAAAEKFSSAEDALFGPKAKPKTQRPTVAESTAASSAGRILRDLHEPPPPPLPDLPPPARRGHKPGSKNKPKPVLASVPSDPTPVRARPAWADAVAAQYPDPRAEAVPASDAVSTLSTPDLPAPPSSPDAGSAPRRTRLRDRSSILKRYVLGTEPAPGQAGWVRSLRGRRRG